MSKRFEWKRFNSRLNYLHMNHYSSGLSVVGQYYFCGHFCWWYDVIFVIVFLVSHITLLGITLCCVNPLDWKIFVICNINKWLSNVSDDLNGNYIKFLRHFLQNLNIPWVWGKMYRKLLRLQPYNASNLQRYRWNRPWLVKVVRC